MGETKRVFIKKSTPYKWYNVHINEYVEVFEEQLTSQNGTVNYLHVGKKGLVNIEDCLTIFGLRERKLERILNK